jgi:hypothetical protein
MTPKETTTPATTLPENDLETAAPIPPVEVRSPGVFVIGCPRSGTSVLSWSLAAHPNFWTSAESDYLLDLFGSVDLHSAYKRAVSRPDGGWLQKNKVGFREFASAMGVGVEYLYQSRSKSKRWVDSTPGYTLMAETLSMMCPAAKFLHIVRDGRAVVCSMLKSGFNTDWSDDFKKACHTWVRYVSIGRRFVIAHPDVALEVRYESMTALPEETFGAIFSFLGEEFSPKAVTLITTKRINSSYGNEKAEDIRKAKDPAAAPKRPWEQWSAQQQAAFKKVAGPTMMELGFE